MTITFACDCGRGITAPDHEAGERMLCPGCFELVRVPQPPGGAERSGLERAELSPGAAGARTRGGLLMAVSGLQVGLGAFVLGLPLAGLLAVLLV